MPQATAPRRLDATHDLEIVLVCPAPAGKRLGDLTRAAAAASKCLRHPFPPCEGIVCSVLATTVPIRTPARAPKLQTRAGGGHRGPVSGRRQGVGSRAHTPPGVYARTPRGTVPAGRPCRRWSEGARADHSSPFDGHHGMSLWFMRTGCFRQPQGRPTKKKEPPSTYLPLFCQVSPLLAQHRGTTLSPTTEGKAAAWRRRLARASRQRGSVLSGGPACCGRLARAPQPPALTIAEAALSPSVAVHTRWPTASRP